MNYMEQFIDGVLVKFELEVDFSRATYIILEKNVCARFREI